ncbi:MazG nucleotide pyrophosphohydrolase domain-containing protein [Panacagrimonas sp.]|uniref:nucleoside triphosphate pyrophosphohydrolase family protein n=1 Tax=Panacagrimonas sp. TaxID=2480088 RepID=UPI003B517E83
MDFDRYQELSFQTDQQSEKKDGQKGLLIPLLGLAGETGTLLAEFKKKLRDKQTYDGFDDRAEEELGDILWYVSNIASRLKLSMSKIAARNLLKTQERWPIDRDTSKRRVFDLDYPDAERLPRQAAIRVFQDEKRVAHLELVSKQCLLGDKLTDNAYDDDGYRFHDVLHLAHWAVLGWSPVARKMLGAKRRSNPEVDEVEDGARAAIIEELLVAFVYSNAKQHSLYRGAKHLDSEMLSTIKRLVLHLEVKERPVRDWDRAIQQGYAAFRFLREHGEATLLIDMDKRTLKVMR